MTLATTLGRLRLVGLLEGLSFVVLLFVAMPLKYVAGQPEAVRVVGMAHGVLFIAYLLAIAHAHMEYNGPWKRSALLVLASLFPFGPFLAESKILKPLAAREAMATSKVG